MFFLPPADHKAREFMGDIAHVAEVLAPGNRALVPTFPEARAVAKRMFANGAVKRVFSICMRADGEFWLISVGARGGWRKEWNFGKG